MLSKWIIKYDSEFDMPQFIQGTMIGENSKFKNGARVHLNGILCLDMKDKTVLTSDELRYKLVGPGKRMLLLNEEEIQALEEYRDEEF